MPIELMYKNFNYEKLDKIIHNRLRLAVLSALGHSEEVDFVSLKNAVKATDGNLSIQLKKLEQQGYIATNKIMAGNRPQTVVGLTNQGRNALLRYKKLLDTWFDFE